jgi:hypothetical protein
VKLKTTIQANQIKTMKKGILMTAMIGALSAGAVLGQTDTTSSTYTQTTPTTQTTSSELYRPSEFSVDLFGGGTLNQHEFDHLSGDTIRHDGRLGLGAGGNIFLTRYIGIGGDFYTENPNAHFVDQASGSLILRVPIGETGLAPYIFGGGGHMFDPTTASFGHGGAGLEFRFCQNVGLFVDARYVFTDQIGNYGLGRAGLRIAF